MNLQDLRDRKLNLGSILILHKHLSFTVGFKQINNYDSYTTVYDHRFIATVLAEKTVSKKDVFVLTLSSYGVLWLFKQDCDLLCE